MLRYDNITYNKILLFKYLYDRELFDDKIQLLEIRSNKHFNIESYLLF